MYSNLLITDHPLMVLPRLAVAIGLNEAIVLQQVHFWCEVYRGKGETNHYHDGHWWIYNTYEKWQENFPFWCTRTIRRTIANLREPQGASKEQPARKPLLVVGNFNQKGYDQTLWYRIDYDALRELESGLPPEEELLPATGQDVQAPCGQDVPLDVDKITQPIPETTTEITLKSVSKKKLGPKPSPTPPSESEVVPPSHKVYFAVLNEVCKLDIRIADNRGRINRCAKMYREAGYDVELLRKRFGQGGWWYKDWWQGKTRGDPPTPEDIGKHWLQAEEADPIARRPKKQTIVVLDPITGARETVEAFL
jgi:hypothetical protein